MKRPTQTEPRPFGLHSLSNEALVRVRTLYLRKIEDFIAGRTPIRGREGEYTDLRHWLDATDTECERRRDLLVLLDRIPA